MAHAHVRVRVMDRFLILGDICTTLSSCDAQSFECVYQVSLMSPPVIAAAAPMRTAVEPAAASEFCPSTGCGTSGE